MEKARDVTTRIFKKCLLPVRLKLWKRIVLELLRTVRVKYDIRFGLRRRRRFEPHTSLCILEVCLFLVS